MAQTLMSLGGNFATAASWAICDATAESDSEANFGTVTTSYQTSSTFTPGAITIDAIAVKVQGGQVGTTGTMTVALDLATVDVAGTVVTINMTELNTAPAANGWAVFKLAAPVLLLAATAYGVKVKTSSSGQINLFFSAGTNWSRQLRTTATSAAVPAAGEKLIICGELASTSPSFAGNNITITHDSTATTSYGATTFPQSIHVSKRGTYSWANSATALYLKWKGVFGVYSGGTLNVGTSVTSINSGGSAVLEMDSAVNVDSGLVFANGSTVNIYGATKATLATLLTADKAAAATVITLASTSGWAASDDLAFASTTRTAADCEKKTITTVDSATQVTLSAGLTNAHSGTSPTQAEVINLTRNVKIRGISASLQGYVLAAATSVVNVQYVEFTQLGSATTGKRGIDSQTTTGTFIFKFNAVHDSTVVSSIGINVSGASGQTATTHIISSNVGYNNSANFYTIAVTTGTWVVDSNVGLLSAGSGGIPFALLDVGGTFTNNTAVGGTTGISASESAGIVGTWSGNTAHSNSSVGVDLNGLVMSTLNSITAWRNNGTGLRFSNSTSLRNLILDSVVLFGNLTNNMQLLASDVLFTNAVLSGDTTFATTTGVSMWGTSGSAILNIFENSTFGVVSGIKTAHTQDFQMLSGTPIICRNCLMASATEVLSFASATTFRNAFVLSQKHDQTAGLHKFWLQFGVGSIDTAIFNTASPSLRLTPNTAGSKLESAPQGYGWTAAVASGGTITASVATRKSVSTDSGGANYNGAQQRLIVRKNIAAGISADTVLATAAAAVGTWETLSGTTASVTDDATLEFILDCDGTAGWISCDDFVAIPVTDTKGFKYWQDGVPCVSGDNISMIMARVRSGY